MKRLLLVTGLCLLFTAIIQAQSPKYRVVFDMTSQDSVNQQSLIRQLTYIMESNASAQLEVVIYGQGLSLVTKGATSQQAAVSRLLTDKGVAFKVCAAAMKRYNIDKTQLLQGVEIVPDGIYEIIEKQQEGWGYIKVAH